MVVLVQGWMITGILSLQNPLPQEVSSGSLQMRVLKEEIYTTQLIPGGTMPLMEYWDHTTKKKEAFTRLKKSGHLFISKKCLLIRNLLENSMSATDIYIPTLMAVGFPSILLNLEV